MDKYIDLFVGKIRFDDIGELFFAGLFYWMAWQLAGVYGVVGLTAIFLMRLKRIKAEPVEEFNAY